MSLEKKRIQDQIEIVGKFKTIQVRYRNQIIEDGNVLSENFHRDSIECGNIEEAIEHNVEKIAKVVWTSEVKKSYKSYKARM